MERPGDLYEQLVSRPKPHGFPDRVVLPDYDGFCVGRIPDLILAALGLPHTPGPLVRLVSPPPADRALLIILDGLGYNRFHEMAARDDDVRSLAQSTLCVPLTTVFPSTTVAALTTYSTGLAPSQHGMLGYRLYLREVSAIVNMIQFSIVGGRSEAPLPEALPIDRLLACPTLYERLTAEGVTSHLLSPRAIAQSGLSRLLYRGVAHIQPSLGLSDMLASARQILSQAQERTVVTLYWPGLDSAAHARGPGSDSYLAEAASVAAAIRREIVGRVPPTLLLISSDHGFVSMRPSDYLPISALRVLKRPPFFFPVGEPRASYLFLHPDDRDEVLSATPTLGEGSLFFIASQEALRTGLFGGEPFHPDALARLGDLIAVSTQAPGLLHPYPDAALLAGMHGGLTADEMVVPLLVNSL